MAHDSIRPVFALDAQWIFCVFLSVLLPWPRPVSGIDSLSIIDIPAANMTPNSPQTLTDLALHPGILQVPKSATLAINEKSKELRRAGKQIYRLGLGQSPFPVPELMVSRLQGYARAKDYMAVQGYLPLREAIAGMLRRSEGLDSQARHILVGPGSKELLFGLQMALDCELLLPAPSWVSYEPQARLLSRPCRWIETRPENGWKLRAEDLRRQTRERGGKIRQLLILNSPNNPSGACYSEAELQALAEVARRHGILILSDEIYSELHYRGEHRSMARYYPEGTLVSNGISKWAGAGGWRLGFLAFPAGLDALLQSMIVIASETFTSVSAPIQMASICAFEDSPAMLDYIHACRRIMAGIGRDFSRRLREAGLQVAEPEGGFYCLPDFTPLSGRLRDRGIESAADLATRLLEDTGVAGLPGSDFGLRDHLALRFACVDFDGAELLRAAQANPDLTIDLQLPQLQRLRQAAERICDWLHRS